MSKKHDQHVLQGHVAGFVTRLFSYMIDFAVVAGLLALFGWLAVTADSVIGSLGLDPQITFSMMYLFAIPAIIGGYYVMFWALTGRTIGKWFMGLKVVGRNGLPPTIGRSLLRFIGYGLSMLVFWGGYFWVIIDDERQAWHDHLAKTWVIYDYERRKPGEVYTSFLRRSSTAQETDN